METMNNIQTPIPAEEETIDLVELLQRIWVRRKFVLIVTGIFMALGLFVALLTPNQYTASCTMVPQVGDKRGSSLGGLAAMAGINMMDFSSGEVLSPNVYPRIIENVNFQKELIYKKYIIKDVEVPVTYYEYATNPEYWKFNLLDFLKKYTIGLPGIILKAIRGTPQDMLLPEGEAAPISRLTYNEQLILKNLYKVFLLELNPKEGYITLSTTMRDPYLAAQLTTKGQLLLQEYLTQFKLQKVQANLEFVEESYREAKTSFEAKQEELARFRDANVNLTSAVARTREEKLQSEYTLLLSVYTELAKQKEQAKIAVTETTPILTVIEPVVVPVEKSKPARAKMLMIYTFLGLVVGVVWVLGWPAVKDAFK